MVCDIKKYCSCSLYGTLCQCSAGGDPLPMPWNIHVIRRMTAMGENWQLAVHTDTMLVYKQFDKSLNLDGHSAWTSARRSGETWTQAKSYFETYVHMEKVNQQKPAMILHKRRHPLNMRAINTVRSYAVWCRIGHRNKFRWCIPTRKPLTEIWKVRWWMMNDEHDLSSQPGS